MYLRVISYTRKVTWLTEAFLIWGSIFSRNNNITISASHHGGTTGRRYQLELLAWCPFGWATNLAATPTLTVTQNVTGCVSTLVAPPLITRSLDGVSLTQPLEWRPVLSLWGSFWYYTCVVSLLGCLYGI